MMVTEGDSLLCSTLFTNIINDMEIQLMFCLKILVKSFCQHIFFNTYPPCQILHLILESADSSRASLSAATPASRSPFLLYSACICLNTRYEINDSAKLKHTSSGL